MSPSPKLLKAMAQAIRAVLNGGHLRQGGNGHECAQDALQAALDTGEVVIVTPKLRDLLAVALVWGTPDPFASSDDCTAVGETVLDAAIAYARSIEPRETK